MCGFLVALSLLAWHSFITMKTNLKMPFLIISVLAVAGIGLFLMKDEDIKEKKLPVDEKSIDYEELVFPNNTLDTSDWETYRTSNFSKDIAIRIKYPKGWKVESYDENEQGSKARVVIFDNRLLKGSDNGVYIEVEPFPINAYIAQSSQAADYKHIKINNTYGYALKNQSGFSAMSVKLKNTKGDSTFSFYIIGPDAKNPTETGHYASVLENVLLSFQLVE